MPRVVLPITSRGLELTDRACWVILGAAMVISAGLILYLNRGTTFFVDEVYYIGESDVIGVHELFTPINGHLAAVSRLYFKAWFEAFGTDYVAFRLAHVAMVMLAAGLFFAVAKRRMGAVPALAPTLVLLFLGSAWHHLLIPIGVGIYFTIALGLAALLFLERDDLLGDVAACAAVCIAIATFSIGLVFLVGLAVSVLIRPDRRRRAWIFLVPLFLYAAWWIWALDLDTSSTEQTKVSNILLIPVWTLDSVAVLGGALTGLDYPFADDGRLVFTVGWGRIVAALAIVALVWRFARGNLPASIWVSLAIALSYWALGALAGGVAGRVPGLTKYIVPGAFVALLVATDAARGLRFSRLALALLFGATAFSLATNLAQLRDGASYFRDTYTPNVRAQLAMVELARKDIEPTFNPFSAVPELAPDAITAPAGKYLDAVDRFGSPAFSLPDLGAQPDPVRQTADIILVNALDLELRSSGPLKPGGGCRMFHAGEPGQPIGFELPRGGARLEVRGPEQAQLTVGRFGSTPSVEVGNLSPDEPAKFRIPTDSSPIPWRASVAHADSVELCPSRE